MGKTEIQWTDFSWNPVTGCTKVSPGCKFCYAERVTDRFGRVDFSKIVLHHDRLEQPLHLRAPRRVFVNSMSDLFHERIPDDFIGRVFDMMAMAERHTFQVLTKRAERMRDLLQRWEAEPARQPRRTGFPNVWLGVSAEDQQRADERIPLLLQTPAAVRFVSLEPLLGHIRLHDAWLYDYVTGRRDKCFVDWVIVGGESGGPPERALVVKNQFGWHPRLPHFEWSISLRDQCQA